MTDSRKHIVTTSDNNRRAALVDAMASRMMGAIVWHVEPDTRASEMTPDEMEKIASAVLNIAMEEAAKVIDQMPLSHPGNAAETAIECAAAIRALKGTP